MATPIAYTLMKSIFEIRIHSLQHINRYVGNGVANVVLEVCYGPWSIDINQRFQITPWKEIAWRQIWRAWRPLEIASERDEAVGEMLSQQSRWVSFDIFQSSDGPLKSISGFRDTSTLPKWVNPRQNRITARNESVRRNFKASDFISVYAMGVAIYPMSFSRLYEKKLGYFILK